jgi:2-polyprenyl-6-methoxyphenol hydroxylase-like FAD-dependent oxidoreductase
MVPQFLTEAVLRERLSELGHAPEFASALTALTAPASHHAGVAATRRTAQGDETVRARYLVGCDAGAALCEKSMIRWGAGVDLEVASSSEVMDRRSIRISVQLDHAPVPARCAPKTSPP